MKYMLLIYDDEKRWNNFSEAERRKLFGEYRQFGEQISSSGNHLAGAPLQPTSAATSVRVREGQRLVTDGPLPRRASNWAATILSKPRISTRRSASPPGFRRRASAPSKSGP